MFPKRCRPFAVERGSKKEIDMSMDEKSTVICLSCMMPNDGMDNSCRNCGAALSTGSSLDPVQTLQNEGALLRKAVSARPKLIVLIGTWILFVPWIVGTIFLEIQILENWDGLPSMVFFLLGVALFLAAVIIIYSVTRNYQRARETFENEKEINRSKDENRLQAKARRRERMKNKAG